MFLNNMSYITNKWKNEGSNFEVSSYNLCPDTFDKGLGKLFSNSLSLSHVNIRSLQKNYDELSPSL